MYTIKDLVRRAVTVQASGPAVIDGQDIVTWSAFLDRIQAIAGALVQRGLRKGDRVAIVSLNSARYFELIYAVIWAGGIVAPINTRFAAPEVIHCLNDLDGVWIAVDDACLELVDSIRDSVEDVRGLVYLGHGKCHPRYATWPELLDGNRSFVNEEPHVQDLAMIFFTGGTTGQSKGVMLTHGQVLMAAQQSAAGLRTLLSKDIYIHVAPMFHMGDGVMCFVSAIAACANTFLDRFDMRRFVEQCQRDKVSCVTLVPTMVRGLCLYLTETGARIPSLSTIIYGGSPMPEATLELVIKTLPGIHLYQGYGSTEALSITLLEPKHHRLDEEGRRLLRSAGRPFRGVLIGILDGDGHLLPTGQVGEVCVRSNAVMKGYWNKPEMTRKALRDSWFHTGDAGFLDDKGFVFLVDRVKDMVITGGENVYSAEVENVLLSHGAVEECAIIGLPDERWGERVHAIVRLKPEITTDPEALSTHCRQQLAGYKVPKTFEFVDQPLPRTPLGKIRKPDLRAGRGNPVRTSAETG